MTSGGVKLRWSAETILISAARSVPPTYE